MNKTFWIAFLVGAVIAFGGYFAIKALTTPKTDTALLKTLEGNWETAQALIPVRPTFHNQDATARGVWRLTAAQFIGKDTMFVQFEDDNNVHVALLNLKDGAFYLLRFFEGQGQFPKADWEALVQQYGDPNTIYTYAQSLVQRGEIVSYERLTKVSENVFVQNYWEN